MPKSRRDTQISLTRTKKKGLELKQSLVEEIRKCVDQYARVYVFSSLHMKTNRLQDIRVHWSNSRFFLGKNKVMALALGRTPEEEIQDNLHKVSQKLVGQGGLLFTNATNEEVIKYFDNAKFPVTPHAGDIASETVELKQGLLEQFSHALEPHLRKLGLPTRIERGVPELMKDYVVCIKGHALTPTQASILKLLEKDMSFFQLKMEWCWNRLNGTFDELNPSSKDEYACDSDN
ncbi:hypothetical protein Pmani_027206 [Petrolisthes manimaculis]|uniref:Ribosome assembly factor mrt4 n=1 Tax=Petrolisthes manimaculis TaxID=1843537 RepID=A0AAE1P4N7_9EUCA|nr:hypothetical protein Pmani_028188 [Petrolisthes manimaculis]KAK4300595.1 hypothetical protein Pmani_027206 [Petrolisthes manimaculis]